jgi:hypothetical protein
MVCHFKFNTSVKAKLSHIKMYHQLVHLHTAAAWEQRLTRRTFEVSKHHSCYRKQEDFDLKFNNEYEY